MKTKTAIVLHTTGIALIASGIVNKWSVEGFIFSIAGGVLCGISLGQIAKTKCEKQKK